MLRLREQGTGIGGQGTSKKVVSSQSQNPGEGEGMMEWWNNGAESRRLEERPKNFGFRNAECGFKSKESGGR